MGGGGLAARRISNRAPALINRSVTAILILTPINRNATFILILTLISTLERSAMGGAGLAAR